MRWPVARLGEVSVGFVDPVQNGRDLHTVGRAIGVAEAVLERVNCLSDAHVVGGQRSVYGVAQRQIKRERRALTGIGCARGVEPLEGLPDAFTDEGAAVEDGLL